MSRHEDYRMTLCRNIAARTRGRTFVVEDGMYVEGEEFVLEAAVMRRRSKGRGDLSVRVIPRRLASYAI